MKTGHEVVKKYHFMPGFEPQTTVFGTVKHRQFSVLNMHSMHLCHTPERLPGAVLILDQ